MKVRVLECEVSIKPTKQGYKAVITAPGTTLLDEQGHFYTERDARIFAQRQVEARKTLWPEIFKD